MPLLDVKAPSTREAYKNFFAAANVLMPRSSS